MDHSCNIIARFAIGRHSTKLLDPLRIEELTVRLVGIPSVNGTPGEGVIADFVAEHLRGLAYFQAHPAQVWTVPLENDRFGRKNVFALVRGEQGHSPETVILHSHTDTVGVEDYGALASAAFDPERLDRELRSAELPADAAQDLASGDWLFGRGVVDMKSGLAVNLELLRTLSERFGVRLEWEGRSDEDGRIQKERDALADLLEEASFFYHRALMDGAEGESARRSTVPLRTFWRP